MQKCLQNIIISLKNKSALYAGDLFPRYMYFFITELHFQYCILMF